MDTVISPMTSPAPTSAPMTSVVTAEAITVIALLVCLLAAELIATRSRRHLHRSLDVLVVPLLGGFVVVAALRVLDFLD